MNDLIGNTNITVGSLIVVAPSTTSKGLTLAVVTRLTNGSLYYVQSTGWAYVIQNPQEYTKNVIWLSNKILVNSGGTPKFLVLDPKSLTPADLKQFTDVKKVLGFA